MRRALMALNGVIVLLGAGIALFASIADAGVLASTGGIHAVLASRGMAGDQTLLHDLFEVVLRLQGPWALVQLLGLGVLVLGLASLALVWRRPG